MKKSKASIITSYVVLILASLVVLLPFIWMVTSSFKSQRELFAFPPSLFPKVWKWENYVQVLNS
ncbi:MAG: carbohydrate ABC transporter permease, partial [Oscillospiraceae bacterium]